MQTTTDKLFWREPYLTTLATTIASVDGTEVALARTIFYAMSGGQESDRGTIGGHPVLAARKDGLRIVYTLPDGHGLRAGDPVEVRIDGARRLALMRLHFAAELVLELVTRRHPGIVKIGAHIAEDKARVDFEWPENLAAELPSIRDEALAIVRADPEIVSAFSDEARERRYWRIPGFAQVPCGGTHPRRAGEVGDIALKRRNVGRGKERIEIVLAGAA